MQGADLKPSKKIFLNKATILSFIDIKENDNFEPTQNHKEQTLWILNNCQWFQPFVLGFWPKARALVSQMIA